MHFIRQAPNKISLGSDLEIDVKTTVIAAAEFLVGTGLGLAILSDTAFAQKPPPPPPPPPEHSGQAPDAKPRPPAKAGTRAAQGLQAQGISSRGEHSLRGEVWVDNWFRFFVDGKPLAEDSVPLPTERSFNAERFDFQVDYPMTLAFEFRDFMENATGLECIGTRRQQLGDGGAIAQFTDRATGKVVAATGSEWRCMVQQAAPAKASCEREDNPRVGVGACAQEQTPVPADWAAPGFDDSTWQPATVHSARDVRPKDGYDQIRWDPSASLIWGPDLKRDNVVLCRITIAR